MERRVVVTGVGIVGPLGNSLPESVENAFAGKNGIKNCTDYMWGEYGEKVPTHVGGTVVGLDASKYIPAKFVDRYDPHILFAIAATKEALEDSGIEFTDALRDRTAVIIGTALAGITTITKALHLSFAEKRAHEMPGYVIMQCTGNMPSGLVALFNKFRGPTMGIVNACAAGGTSVSIASDYIRTGRIDVAVAGGTEAPIGLISHASFAGASAIVPTHDPERASRPFNVDRAGFVVGEGSAIMILESLESAQARGAKIYGEVIGDAQTNDAYHIIRPEPGGKSWARVMQLAMENAGIQPGDVDYISAHAASTGHGDLVETQAIKIALGEHAYKVPVSSTKSMHGHLFGAAGAIEMALALGAMQRNWVLPTINLTDPDPECDLDYVPNKGREQETHVLMKNSFGFGGTNTCTIIRKI